MRAEGGGGGLFLSGEGRQSERVSESDRFEFKRVTATLSECNRSVMKASKQSRPLTKQLERNRTTPLTFTADSKAVFARLKFPEQL